MRDRNGVHKYLLTFKNVVFNVFKAVFQFFILLWNPQRSDSRYRSGFKACPDSNLLKRDFAAASELERQGFERLLERDFNGARRAFEAVERTYPSFHQAYEIARLLQREQSRLPSPEVQRRVLTRIISDYSWKAPADLLTAIERSLANYSARLNIKILSSCL